MSEMPLVLCHDKIITLSRILKDLRVLLCLQDKKLACYSFLVSEKRYGDPGSKAEHFITHVSSESMNYVFVLLFSPVL